MIMSTYIFTARMEYEAVSEEDARYQLDNECEQGDIRELFELTTIINFEEEDESNT